MAIMARMLNIPTRVVNGFSQGIYNAQNNQWVVDGSDAHSWVQAFLPNYGWVNFDPTPGFSPNAQPVPSPQATVTPVPSSTSVPKTTATATPKASPTPPSGNHPNTPNSSMTSSGDNNTLFIIVAVIGLFLAVLLFLFALIRYWWRRLYRSSTLVSSFYWRFCRAASFLGLAPRAWQTPYEYSRTIGQRFPSQAQSLWHLTDLFVREHWGGPQNATQARQENDVQQLWPAIRSLLVKLFWQRFKRKT